MNNNHNLVKYANGTVKKIYSSKERFDCELKYIQLFKDHGFTPRKLLVKMKASWKSYLTIFKDMSVFCWQMKSLQSVSSSLQEYMCSGPLKTIQERSVNITQEI